MIVKPIQLQPGCITMKPVLSITNNSIVKEGTVLTDEHIAFINAFLVNTVKVEQHLENGEVFEPLEVIETEQPIEQEKKVDFISTYIDTVQQYKKLFKSWEAGNQVNYFSVETILQPLLTKIIDSPEYLLHLHHYSKKEEYLYQHPIYVAILSTYIAYKLNHSKVDSYKIGMIGALADSGMAKLPPTILMKKGPLTAAELEDVKKHPVHSYKMLKGVVGVTDSLLIAVLQHHERHDGSGYPMGTNSSKTHMFSQIVAVADVYHAMTSERYHRAKRSPYQVLEEISQELFGQFELTVVEALIQSIIQISIGTKVRLTTGEEAEIVFFEKQTPTKPMVKLASNGEIIQLAQHSTIHIQELISSK